MLPLLFVAIIAPQNPAVEPAPPPDLRVVVTAPVYYPDGAVAGETTTVGGAGPTVVYLFSRRSLCETAASSVAEPADAGFGWRVASHVVKRSETQAVISVDWRRMWDRGRKVTNGPAGAAQLTLAPGDRIPLDHIPNMLPDAACGAVGMGLEVRLGRAASLPRTVTQTLPTGARVGGAGSLDVDLWLVHTRPGGSQQAQHQTVRLTTAGGMFTFAPITFDTRRGDVAVELTGAFQRFSATGGELLLVSMSRVITAADGATGRIGGSSSSLIALPTPDEVLSFEMIAPSGGGFGSAGGRGGSARSRGGFSGGTGGGARSSAGSGGGEVAQRGGGGGARSGVRGSGPAPADNAGANMLRAVSLLDGHQFSIRVKVTPVPGT